ncbi:phosphate acyltransferase PlsX [Mycoplasma sp. NEAQ87857]|uniref:phosphate acyltransferase PlsX n=1 Tax=Mycoplasma sp. NEAQ87857 TaxID=2683967 RepID=UPI001315CA78|nr:phosphate acyltransferase PlsX [Mycoplasma sp. NEAQ87857]QGZ97780.1 phosphate acyltransferase PlsX [Mycoplasma sp. NEAQ87857]
MQNQTFKIVFDINGNDNGPFAAYQAAKGFALKNQNFEIILVGDTSNLDLTNKPNNITLIENKNVQSDPKNLRQAMKEDCSMNVAIEILKNNQADAILSSGDSGCYISALTFKCGRIPNVSRPAFMPVCNATNGNKFLFLDVGANLVVKPEYLYEWAVLATSFYQVMFNKSNPSVTLLNIGTEEYKGNEVVKEANTLLKNDSSLNYVGFNETRDLFKGKVDIALIDGYGGNLVLKSYEGAIFTFVDLLKNRIKSSFIRKIGASIIKGAFKETAKVLDYRNVGCAWVFGVNALAIKTHGSSDALSYTSALNNIKEALEKDLLTKLKGSVNEKTN